ncbi:major histocompatibility complex class I-related gene protein-like isoform X2 [Phyllobates terribilis]|uniref:major histocompatibility complex class I-related gene protein-like isoform X2 n=1 Tax=Phyllobates terribilis TaxID=111132 RepID=UPI003CCAFA2B
MCLRCILHGVGSGVGSTPTGTVFGGGRAPATHTHSLQYYFMGVSAPGSGLPEFSVAGYVDDQQATLYSSDTGRSIVAQWIMENEGPEILEQETKHGKKEEASFTFEAKLWKKRFSHTEGFHFLQLIQSCELRDDGSTMVSQQIRYDGRDYMYLDIQKELFIPTMADARIVSQRWNSPDVRKGERCKVYLETECITKLKRFLEHGREVLERRVRPQVKVSGQEKGDTMKLHCQVYGFHPRAVDVKWMKNGKDEVHSYETTHVLPNPDGTYQIRVSAEVTPKEGDRYSCYVDHSSLEEPLLVQWEPKQSMTLVMIISAVVVVIIVLVSAGIFIHKKKESFQRSALRTRPLTMINQSQPEYEEEDRRLRSSTTREVEILFPIS